MIEQKYLNKYAAFLEEVAEHLRNGDPQYVRGLTATQVSVDIGSFADPNGVVSAGVQLSFDSRYTTY